MRIAIILNPAREDAVQQAFETAAWLQARGHEAGIDSYGAEAVDIPVWDPAAIAASDLVLTLGGDGTMIRAAGWCSERGTPILGAHFGRFGFVTQCEPLEVRDTIEKFIAGELSVEERMMLQIDLVRNGSSIATFHSLNEVVIHRSVTDRVLTFEVIIDGCRLTRYPADGALVATPTGSTAYNLSIGGPILEPSMEAMIVNALAPHTLSARALVLSPQAEVMLRIGTEGETVLSVDGKRQLHVLHGDHVRVVRSPRRTRLVQLHAHDFLRKLGERLLWSYRVEGTNG